MNSRCFKKKVYPGRARDMTMVTTTSTTTTTATATVMIMTVVTVMTMVTMPYDDYDDYQYRYDDDIYLFIYYYVIFTQEYPISTVLPGAPALHTWQNKHQSV